MSKDNQPQTDDQIDEPIDHSAQLHKHKNFNEMETERKDIMANPCTIQ